MKSTATRARRVVLAWVLVSQFLLPVLAAAHSHAPPAARAEAAWCGAASRADDEAASARPGGDCRLCTTQAPTIPPPRAASTSRPADEGGPVPIPEATVPHRQDHHAFLLRAPPAA